MKTKISRTANRLFLLLFSLLIFLLADSKLFFYGQRCYLKVLEAKPDFLNPIITREYGLQKLFFQEAGNTPFGLREGDLLSTSLGNSVVIDEITGYAYSEEDFYVFTFKERTHDKIKVLVNNFSVNTRQFIINENWEVPDNYRIIEKEPIYRIGLLLWVRRLFFIAALILILLLVTDFFNFFRKINM